MMNDSKIIAIVDSLSTTNAIKYGNMQFDHFEVSPSGTGIRMVMSDLTTYLDIELTGLNLLYKTDLSDSITTNSSTTPASSKAIYDVKAESKGLIDAVVAQLNDYLKKTQVTNDISTNSADYVPSSQVTATLNNNKLNKSDIATTIFDSDVKVAAISILFDLQEKFKDYVVKTDISNEIGGTSATKVASELAVKTLKEDVATKYIPLANTTSNFNGSSETLVLNQLGAKLIKDLISTAVSGMTPMGNINETNFNALASWSQGELWFASEDITFKTVEIPNKAWILFKTDSVEGVELATTDFDFVTSALQISHTAEEVDKAVEEVLNSKLAKLGFVDIENCALSYNEATRTISIKPITLNSSTHCYINNVKITIDTERSIIFPDTTGVHFVTLSEAGVLSVQTSYSQNDYSVMPICFVRWNATTQKINALFDLRVHNLDMNPSNRAFLYDLGTQWQSGFEMLNFGVGAVTDNSICQFGLTSGKIRLCEKLLSYNNNVTPILPYEDILNPYCNTKIYYINGSKYTNDSSDVIPLKKGVIYPMYNKNTNGVFSLVETTKDKYICMFIGLSTDFRPSESSIAIMGQGVYNTIDECRSEKLNVTKYGDLEHRQFKFLYKIIYHISDTYTNSYHAKAVEYSDIRKYSLIQTFADDNAGKGGDVLNKVDIVNAGQIVATPNTIFYLRSGANGAVITLPSTGINQGDRIIILDADGILTNHDSTVTLDGIDATVNNSADTYIMNVKYCITSFQWTNNTWFADFDGLLEPEYIDTVRVPSSTVTLSSLNIPLGVTPSNPNLGDVWNDGGLRFQKDLNTMVSMLPDVGDIKMTARITPPSGWLLCNGSAVSRTQYAELFQAIGTAYGAGDGTTFNLPNLNGRVPVGLDASQTEFNAIGKIGGSKTHTLTTAEMPNHTHGYLHRSNFGSSGSGSNDSWFGLSTKQSDSAGNGNAHNNLSPYLTVLYVIKY